MYFYKNPFFENPYTSNDDIENVANTQDHSHSNDTTQDLCSPFCQCHCCHVHVVEILINDFETINNEIFTHQFIHFNNSGKEITKRLLQPPRV